MSQSVDLIAFGSCNRQKLPQSFWPAIGDLKPDLFLWLGDAVYTKGYSYPALPMAFNQLLSNSNYTTFAANTNIDGVWDDHDYGVNDGGINVVDKDLRAQEYMRFLHRSNPNLPNDDESYSWMDITGKHGLYHARSVKMGNVNIKFLFLDTRSFRQNHYLPSLGQYKFPLSAIIASAIRGAYSVLGFGRQYDGDVLGEEQWQWLNNELENSNADAHFVVSSIQVLTSNPVVESWGHFPMAKKRLMALLAKRDPKQLSFLSGDVHLAEISTATARREDGSKTQWKEITSSGLTHTCQDNVINRVLCPAMLYLFNQHRDSMTAFYAHRNFGTIKLEHVGHSDDSYQLEIDIKSLEPSQMLQTPNLMKVQIPLSKSSSAKPAAIVAVDYADFYVIPWYLQLLVFVNIFLFLRYLFVVRKSTKRKGVADAKVSKQD